MPQGLVETEPNLVWIFRGFSIKLFIRNLFKMWFPPDIRRKSSFYIMKNSFKKNAILVKVVIVQAESPRLDSPPPPPPRQFSSFFFFSHFFSVFFIYLFFFSFFFLPHSFPFPFNFLILIWLQFKVPYLNICGLLLGPIGSILNPQIWDRYQKENHTFQPMKIQSCSHLQNHLF